MEQGREMESKGLRGDREEGILGGILNALLLPVNLGRLFVRPARIL